VSLAKVAKQRLRVLMGTQQNRTSEISVLELPDVVRLHSHLPQSCTWRAAPAARPGGRRKRVWCGRFDKIHRQKTHCQKIRSPSAVLESMLDSQIFAGARLTGSHLEAFCSCSFT